MFEKYTDKARRVIFFARYEAAQHRTPNIETPSLLLGLLREEKDLFASLLPGGAEEIGQLVEEIEALSPKKGTGPRISTSVDLPLSAACKRALTHGAAESDRLHHSVIDPRHLLFGLLKTDGPEVAVLAAHGIDMGKVISTFDSSLDRGALHRLLDQVPPERLQAAVTLLAGLNAEKFDVSGTTPGGPFHYSFGGAAE